MKNLLTLHHKLIPDKFSIELVSKETIENYKKPAIIVGSVFGTILIGTLVIRKIYVKKINDLVDETTRRENEKKIKIQSDATKPVNTITLPKDQSNSLPTTPSNQPNSPGLSILVDRKLQSGPLDRMSLNSHFIGRNTNRKRNPNSICSYQLNLQIDNPVELIIFGNEYVKRALKILEDVKSRNKEFEVQNTTEFEEIINSTKTLIEQIQNFTKLSQINEPLPVIDTEDNSSLFGSPEGSVASSLYSLAFYDTEPNIHFFKLYTSSLENVEKMIRPRVDRSQTVNCESVDEFYAKVNCIRNGFQHIFTKEQNRDYFVQIGEYILKVLIVNDKEQQECLRIYKDMIDFISNPDNFDTVTEELGTRNIPILSFYDLVLDYIILDSFDDLENPPSTIISVVNQRWFGDTFKIKALQTAINIVLKHKRSKLKISDGFFSRFYCLLEIISPILAWGFFGTDSDLKLKCNFIKQAIFEVVRDFFDFDRVRYTSVHDLTIDMLSIVDIRYEDLQNKISILLV